MPASAGDFYAALRAAATRRGPSWIHADSAMQALDALHRAGDPTPDPDRVTDLTRRFDLDPVAAQVFSVALLAETDPGLHLVCGLLSGDDGAERPTVALTAELLMRHPDEVRQALGPSAGLRRHGLLNLDGSGPVLARRLRLADAVVAALSGDELPPPELVPLLAEPVPVALAESLQVEAALRQGHSLIWIQAGPSTAGAALAADACRLLDVSCVVVDLRRLPDVSDPTRQVATGEVDRIAAAAVLYAGLTGQVLILTGAEHLAGRIWRFAQSVVPVVLVGNRSWDPWWADRLPVCIQAPRLGPQERSGVWWPLLGGQDPDAEIAALRLSPEEIVRTARHARDMAGVTSGSHEVTGGIDAEQIRRAARRLGRSPSARPRPDREPASMSDLVLPEYTRSEVQRLLDWARYRDVVLAQGPLQGKGGKGTGICALFSGSPGTGKTLAAHVLADTLGMELYTVDLSAVISKYIGETEQNLEHVFTEAESLNAILFFDEADALFGSRSEVKDSRDRYANQEVAYLLQRMEAFDGITVLATNLRGNLDTAFARRLHFMIHFPDPDAPTRAKLWQHHLNRVQHVDPGDPVDVAALADTVELAGGEIRNIVLAAAYAAAAEHGAVGMRHILEGTVREYTKLGRRVPARPLFATVHSSTGESR